VLDADSEAQLAVNAAYRDQLAFWFPARHAATIAYKARSPADGADFDVISVTPKGGREFELWVNVETKMIERLVEHEAIATRTEIYMDWRDVQGVKIPFRVRATRGDPRGRRDRRHRADRVRWTARRRDVFAARAALSPPWRNRSRVGRLHRGRTPHHKPARQPPCLREEKP
jgi:hypothetical protein